MSFVTGDRDRPDGAFHLFPLVTGADGDVELSHAS